MRFYKDQATGKTSHDYLHKVSTMADAFDQCLYLVPEQSNQYDSNAVMLHNGKMKLGSVEAGDAAVVRRLLQKWKDENGGGITGEDVIVVRCDGVYIDPQTFAYKGSVKVRGLYRVNERLARKFSNKHRKEV